MPSNQGLEELITLIAPWQLEASEVLKRFILPPSP